MNFPSNADFNAVVRADGFRGYQLASLLVPPAYITLSFLRKRPFSLNRTLRATWLGGIGGAGAGIGAGYYEGTMGEPYLRERHLALAYDLNRVADDDHATIGAIILGVLTPAIFWKRARAIHLVLGGAGIGSSIGLGTSAYRTYFGGAGTTGATPGPVVPTRGAIPVERSGGGV